MDMFYRIKTASGENLLLDMGITQFSTLIEVVMEELKQLQGNHEGPVERTKVLFIEIEYIPIADNEVQIKEAE